MNLEQDIKNKIIKRAMNFTSFTPVIVGIFLIKIGFSSPNNKIFLILGVIAILLFFNTTVRYVFDVKNNNISVSEVEIIEKYQRQTGKKRSRIKYKNENGEITDMHQLYQKWCNIQVGDKAILVKNKNTTCFYTKKEL